MRSISLVSFKSNTPATKPDKSNKQLGHEFLVDAQLGANSLLSKYDNIGQMDLAEAARNRALLYGQSIKNPAIQELLGAALRGQMTAESKETTGTWFPRGNFRGD